MAVKKISFHRRRKNEVVMKTRSIIVAIGGVAAAVVAILALTAAPRTAQAFPAYAEQTRMTCGVCHENPKGGGKLNAYGIKWVTGGMKTPAAPSKAKK
jgi:hypothetical protein